MTRKKRQLENTVDEIDSQVHTTDDEHFEEERAEARERWDRDAYDDGDEFQKVLDAYTLETDGREAYLDALGFTIHLAYGGPSFIGPINDLPPYDEPPDVPQPLPVPGEKVADALEEYGVARGVDVPALRRRHPDEWVRHFMADLVFEERRRHVRKSAAEWTDAERRETEAYIRRWFDALDAGEWPGTVENGRWSVRPIEEYL